jgi:hypothetical protein
MGEPPTTTGATQFRSTEPSPALAVNRVGLSGGVAIELVIVFALTNTLGIAMKSTRALKHTIRAINGMALCVDTFVVALLQLRL